MNKLLSRCLLVVFILVTTIGGGTQAAYPADPTSDSIVQFEWDIPTERVNGNSLLPSEISGYRIYEDGDLVVTINDGTQTSVLYDYGGYGEACWTISTVDSWGQEGPQSAESCDTVKPSPPSAPSLTISFGA